MNIVKLEDLCDEDGIIKLKRRLVYLKNCGYLFIKESIAELDIEATFEFYHHIREHDYSYRNAFPIPIEDYVQRDQIDDEIKKHFYCSYYQTDSIPDLDGFDKRFLGYYYVWIYK